MAFVAPFYVWAFNIYGGEKKGFASVVRKPLFLQMRILKGGEEVYRLTAAPVGISIPRPRFGNWETSW